MENILETQFVELVGKVARGEMTIEKVLDKIEQVATLLTQELYEKGTLHLNSDMVATLQKMFKFVVLFGDNIVLEAVLYSLLNGNVE